MDHLGGGNEVLLTTGDSTLAKKGQISRQLITVVNSHRP
jgi:hypothetical protein